MSKFEGEEFSIDEMLEKLRPPRTPDEAYEKSVKQLRVIKTWQRNYVAAVLAGLATDPRYHGNTIRIDWLLRLVLSHSAGRRKPCPRYLSRVLNAGLGRAGVHRLEDPVEDLFCNLVATPNGNFRLFGGLWEGAYPYTQTILDAFEQLPSGSIKRDVLISVYSLFQLSDQIAERATVDRYSESESNPQSDVEVPSKKELNVLSERVRFSDKDLEGMGVKREALSPFVISEDYLPHVSNYEAGDTPLEFYCLLECDGDLVVVSPENISLAARAIMISAATSGEMGGRLLIELMSEQLRFSQSTNFWPISSVDLSGPDSNHLYAGFCKYANGRYLQVIQVPAPFDDFPERSFGTIRALSDSAQVAIGKHVSMFWSFLAKQDDVRHCVTVLLLSGWGAPFALSPPKATGDTPAKWSILSLGFNDAEILGACKGGSLVDICRIEAQRDHLESQGFEFRNMSGMVNLFGFWRNTDGNLIPEHMIDIQPPFNLILPTDDLLDPRKEAVANKDDRVLRTVNAEYKRVQRIEWHADERRLPIYASIDDATNQRLVGAVFLCSRTWWIEVTSASERSNEWEYRIWHAVLQWLEMIGEELISSAPLAFPAEPSHTVIEVPDVSSIDTIDGKATESLDVDSTVQVSRAKDDVVTVSISPSWIYLLNRTENDAEVELVAAVLEGIASTNSAENSRGEMRGRVVAAVKSQHWRWLHAHFAYTPLHHMAATGLIGRFHEIRKSAASQAKCGSVWRFRSRSVGNEIEGEEDCGKFLANYQNEILGGLIQNLRQFNRVSLVARASESYQAARAEQQKWRRTIRALRAIHGTAADARAFERQNSINAVQRASKCICELAACESPLNGGVDVGWIDLEELYSYILLLFTNGQLYASMRSGIIEPVLQISPAGDVLSDRSVFQEIMKPVAEKTYQRALNEAAKQKPNQDDTKDKNTDENRVLDDRLRSAIEAEYGASVDQIGEMQHLLIQLAEGVGKGVFQMRCSELCKRFNESGLFPASDTSFLVNRLTLNRRSNWAMLAPEMSEMDIDLSRFDRPYSLINRPLIDLDGAPDPLLSVAPVLVSDSVMYCFSGLLEGSLHDRFWHSNEARKYAGHRANVSGKEFEENVRNSIEALGLRAWVRCKLSWALNQKVDAEFGDIDVLAVSSDNRRVWVIEAKNLRLCRTEAEVSARLSEYRGRTYVDRTGNQKPDKMLRHTRRVKYLRDNRASLKGRLQLRDDPEVFGLLIVDAPQPMNFHAHETLTDGATTMLSEVDSFSF